MKQFLLCACLLMSICVQAQVPDFQWAKKLGGTDYDQGKCLAIDNDGNVYLAGVFRGMADLDPGAATVNTMSSGQVDIFIVKLNPSGNTEWIRRIGGAGNDYMYALTADQSGNIYGTGYFWNSVDFDPGAGEHVLTPVGEGDVFVLKLNSSGDFQWAKSVGGSLDDAGKALSVDHAGNIYVTGGFRSLADFNPGPETYNLKAAGNLKYEDVFILKLDGQGNFKWAKSIGDDYGDAGSGIGTDASGNVYVSGWFRGWVDMDPDSSAVLELKGPSSNEEAFVIKLNASGKLVWARNMGGTYSDYALGIAVNDGGSSYVTGRFTVKGDFDPGDSAFFLTSAGDLDVFISKLDSSGNFLWAKAMGGPAVDVVTSITLDRFDNVYTTGSFSEISDYDPDTSKSFQLTPVGDIDAFISKLDKNGKFVWAMNLGSTSVEYGQCIRVDKFSNVYTTGTFGGTVDFDNGPSVFNLGTGDYYDVFLHKMNTSKTGLMDNKLHGFDVYPNPVNDMLYISTSLVAEELSIEIYNQLGILVYSSASVNNAVDIKGYASGLYIVRVLRGTEIIGTRKIIRQ